MTTSRAVASFVLALAVPRGREEREARTRMRRLVALIGVTVFCAMAASCGSNDNSDRTFNSPVYGYSLKLTAGWSAVPASRASTRISRMQPPGSLVAAETKNGGEAESWPDAVVGAVSFQKGCRRPDERLSVTVDGERGTMLDYPDCPPESGLHHLWVAVTHDGNRYHLVWFNGLEHAKRDQQMLRSLLASFRFADEEP